MSRTVKLLTLALVVLIVLLSMETYAWQVTGGGKANPTRVACVGDSITCGTLYTDDLWLMLGSNYDIGNFGVNGATVFLNSTNPYMDTPALQAAEQFKPQIVIIMLGTNDANLSLNETNAAFIADYTKLIEKFQSLASKPKIWVALPPPIFNNTDGLSGSYLQQNLLPDIRQVANATGTGLIDVYSPLVDHSTDFVDGVHPDPDGSTIVATTIYKSLT